MLKENTGRNFLDSGGIYGRNWERNQLRDFRDEPAGSIKFYNQTGKVDISVTLNVFHYLVERVEFEPTLDRRFQRFSKRPENQDSHWMELIESWLTEIKATGGMYPRDGGKVCSYNTYNGDDLLSQVLQFWIFHLAGDSYVALQIHGGCDVRGGYTAPRIFLCDSDQMFDHARASIVPNLQTCTTTPDPRQLVLPGESSALMAPSHILPCWTTDDAGYCWYNNDGGDNLETYLATDDPEKRGKGFVYIDSAGNGYCPITGGMFTVI